MLRLLSGLIFLGWMAWAFSVQLEYRRSQQELKVVGEKVRAEARGQHRQRELAADGWGMDTR